MSGTIHNNCSHIRGLNGLLVHKRAIGTGKTYNPFMSYQPPKSPNTGRRQLSKGYVYNLNPKMGSDLRGLRLGLSSKNVD